MDKYAKEIEALVDEVPVPRTEVPGTGWWALAPSPEGNQFAIFEGIQS